MELGHDFYQQLRAKFPFLSPAVLELLRQHGRPRELARGEVLVRAGDHEQRIALVKRGLLRHYYLRQGEEVTFLFRAELAVVGCYECLFEGRPTQGWIEAVEPTELVLLPFSLIATAARTDVQAQAALAGLLQRQLGLLLRRLESFLLATPEERYLNFVRQRPDLATRVPLKFLASFLGVTPVSLSRIRARLARTPPKLT